MRRLIVAAAALAAAAAVSGALLLVSSRQPVQAAYVLTRDIPAGAPIPSDALGLVRVNVGEAASSVLGPEDRAVFERALASHDLRSGQLLGRGDVAAVGSGPDRRYVFIPLKDAPPMTTGDRIDLLMITGAADRQTVTPLALGLEVHAVVPNGAVITAPSRQATALVYAALSARLAAVVAGPGAKAGQEPAIAGLDQAAEALHG